jgi:nucleotide-binding universal stress UspA family protein
MFNNAVVGVDGSSSAHDAVALAARLLADGARLTLVNVRYGGPPPPYVVTPDLEEQGRVASEELLHQERDRAGREAELLSVVGASPGGALHEQAEQRGADLLVVGSSRRSVIGRVTLGDDARRALNGAPCAVALAARGYSETDKPLARIGVGYDGSRESRAALEEARAIAAPAGAEVSALEVVSIPSYAYTGVAPALGEQVDTILSEAEERMRALPGVQGSAVYGLTGEELAAFGDRLDLLVVGSRGYGPLKRLVLGSTSDYLQRHARCSLLVLPRSAIGTSD